MLNFRKWKISVPIEQQLYTAVESNNSNEIKAILNKKPTIINKPYEKYDNRTILLLACGRIKNVRTKIIELLLNDGANINFSNQSDMHWSSLHHAIANNERDIAELLLKKERNLLNIRNYDGSNALHIAVKNTVRSCGEDEACECIKFLIEKGINVNQLNRYNETPIFVACRFNYKKVVQTMLDNSFSNQLSLPVKNKFKKNNKKEKSEHNSNKEKCEDTNIKEDAEHNSKETIEICWSILENVQNEVAAEPHRNIMDLDFQCKNNTSARNLIKHKNLAKLLPNKPHIKWEPENKCLVDLRNKNENKYVFNMSGDEIETPLQIACRLNLLKVVKIILIQFNDQKIHYQNKEYLEELDENINPYKTSGRNEELPIEIAVSKSHFDCFKILLKQYHKDHKSLPHQALIKLCSNKKNKKLLEFLIQEISSEKSALVNLNKQQSSDYNLTLVHYIVACTAINEARSILRKGASLAIQNKYGKMPIDDINPELLEDHLNDCFSPMYTKKTPNFRLFECNFKSLLLPQLKNEYTSKENETSLANDEYLNDASEGIELLQRPKTISTNISVRSSGNNELSSTDQTTIEIGASNEKDSSNTVPNKWNSKQQSDIDAIFSISQNIQCKHLLQHPLIVTFLYLKYKKFHTFLLANFWLSVSLPLFLVLFQYFQRIKFLLHVPLILLILRQLFYSFIFVVVNYEYKFKRLRSMCYNLLGIVLIILLILTLIFENHEHGKEFFAFALLLSSLQILIVTDFLGFTHLVILRKVLLNFFNFFLKFIFLIITFAVMFCVIFEGQSNNIPINSTIPLDFEAKEEKQPFGTLGQTLFKTFVMVGGEFEASSIQFTLVTQIVFIFFIFVIYIVLMNLLNGLAVTDVQTMLKDAEVDYLIVQTECIYVIEKILLSLSCFRDRDYYQKWCSIHYQFKMEIEMFGDKSIRIYNAEFEQEIGDKDTKRRLEKHKLVLFNNGRNTENIKNTTINNYFTMDDGKDKQSTQNVSSFKPKKDNSSTEIKS